MIEWIVLYLYYGNYMATEKKKICTGAEETRKWHIIA